MYIYIYIYIYTYIILKITALTRTSLYVLREGDVEIDFVIHCRVVILLTKHHHHHHHLPKHYHRVS
jgi:hypothetical protein